MGKTGGVDMDRKLRTALQTTIDDYYAIDKEINHPSTAPDRGLQLFAAKEALNQVLQHFMNSEYIEYVNGRWQIKIIVVESFPRE